MRPTTAAVRGEKKTKLKMRGIEVIAKKLLKFVLDESRVEGHTIGDFIKSQCYIG